MHSSGGTLPFPLCTPPAYLPSSSMTSKLLGVDSASAMAASAISTAKVDWPAAVTSCAPMRVKIASQGASVAADAGT